MPTLWPSNSTPRYIEKWVPMAFSCIRMFKISLSRMAKMETIQMSINWCVMNQPWSLHTREYILLSGERKTLLIDTTTRSILTNAVSRERNQTQKRTYCKIPFIYYGVEIHMLNWNRQVWSMVIEARIMITKMGKWCWLGRGYKGTF